MAPRTGPELVLSVPRVRLLRLDCERASLGRGKGRLLVASAGSAPRHRRALEARASLVVARRELRRPRADHGRALRFFAGTPRRVDLGSRVVVLLCERLRAGPDEIRHGGDLLHALHRPRGSRVLPSSRDPRAYRRCGLLLGAGFLFHHATVIAGVGFAVALVLTRTADIRRSEAWQGLAGGGVLAGGWAVARWALQHADPSAPHPVQEELVRFSPENVRFYVVAGTALLGLLVLPLYGMGLPNSRLRTFRTAPGGPRLPHRSSPSGSSGSSSTTGSTSVFSSTCFRSASAFSPRGSNPSPRTSRRGRLAAVLAGTFVLAALLGTRSGTRATDCSISRYAEGFPRAKLTPEVRGANQPPSLGCPRRAASRVVPRGVLGGRSSTRACKLPIAGCRIRRTRASRR